MSERLPFMPWEIGEYLATTAHLTTEQHGAYTLLRLYYWTNGSLPKEDAKLAAIVRLPQKRWAATRSVLAAFFGGDWGKHEELDGQRARVRKSQAQKRDAGLKSAEARRAEEPSPGATDVQRPLSGCSTEVATESATDSISGPFNGRPTTITTSTTTSIIGVDPAAQRSADFMPMPELGVVSETEGQQDIRGKKNGFELRHQSGPPVGKCEKGKER